ncbi:DUF4397 domain-containing protein [Niabella sp. CJ426]|uniref:DUF4397 domain-containing protein n=1 Tax=unclassified Niabella TaxID=2646634 RepID=UPI003CFBF912
MNYNFLHFSPRRFAALAFAALAFVSCKKSSSDANYDGTVPASVGIVHASAGVPALDIAFDNSRLGVTTFNYTDRIDYLPVKPGNRSFRIYSASTSTATPIFSKNLVFEAPKSYTVFITDTASKMDAVLIRDSTRAAGSDSVRIRFANMSPDAPALDLYVKDNPTPIATNITYKNAGEFFSHKVASNIQFEVRATGQSTLLATSEPVTLSKVNSNFYTIWSGGYVNGNQAAGTRINIDWFAH